MDLHELADTLTAASRRRLADVLATTGAESGRSMVTAAQANVCRRLRQRSNALLNSIRAETELSGTSLTVRLLAGGRWEGLDVPYARMQEYGGTILPVRAKHLAIPVGDGLTARGTPKYLSPRMMPFAAFRRGRPGGKARWIVFDKRNGQVFFVLVDKTTLTEKRYLRDALDAELRTLPGRLADTAARALVGEA